MTDEPLEPLVQSLSKTLSDRVDSCFEDYDYFVNASLPGDTQKSTKPGAPLDKVLPSGDITKASPAYAKVLAEYMAVKGNASSLLHKRYAAPATAARASGTLERSWKQLVSVVGICVKGEPAREGICAEILESGATMYKLAISNPGPTGLLGVSDAARLARTFISQQGGADRADS